MPHLFVEGPKGTPTGKPVANKRPIDPKDHVEKEYVGRGKVNKTNSANPVKITCFPVGQNGRWVGKDESCYGQYDNGERIDPMEKPNRKLPNIYPSKFSCLHDP